jgi:DNA-binding LacI/PurR family transcriptional regulator
MGKESKLKNGSRLLAIHGLVKLMENGTLRTGEQLPVERTLAERLNVSRPTLRAAIKELKESGLIETEGQGRGRKMVVGKFTLPESFLSESVAVLTDSNLDPAKTPKSGGWESALQAVSVNAIAEAGLHAIVFHVQNLPVQHVVNLAKERLRGVIALRHVMSTSKGAALLAAFREARIPVVLNGPESEGFDRVVSDHAHGEYELTKLLIERGCRRILRYWVVNEELEKRPGWLAMRDVGYTLAMTEAGLPVLPAIETIAPFEMTQDDRSFELMKRTAMGYLIEYVNGPQAIDGIVATTDSNVFPLAAALESLGRKPQKDVLIVGYDNNWQDCAWRKRSEYLPLATVEKNNHLIGKQLVQLLLDRGAHRLPDSPQVRPLIPDVITIPEPSH